VGSDSHLIGANPAHAIHTGEVVVPVGILRIRSVAYVRISNERSDPARSVIAWSRETDETAT
jgi:hypothetical protein